MDHKKNRREGLALLGIGVLITALALHPPRLLCRLYLALEQALAVFLGVLLTLGGLAALLEASGRASAQKVPDYTIEYEES